MDKKINKILNDIELCNGFFDFILEPDKAKIIVDYIQQLQENYCNRTDCSGRIKDSRKYDSLYQKYEKLENKHNKLIEQQKEFIKWLEEEIERKAFKATCMIEYNDYVIPLKQVLQKYEETIGGRINE